MIYQIIVMKKLLVFMNMQVKNKKNRRKKNQLNNKRMKIIFKYIH